MAQLSDLTPREMEVLQLLVMGKTNRKIATEMCVCEKTVEFHLRNIYLKIGVKTRATAAIWAVQHGVTQKTGDFPS